MNQCSQIFSKIEPINGPLLVFCTWMPKVIHILGVVLLINWHKINCKDKTKTFNIIYCRKVVNKRILDSLFSWQNIHDFVMLIIKIGEKPMGFQKHVATFPIFLFFGGESVAMGLSIGYKFDGHVQNCHQVRQNMHKEACHYYYITKLKNKTSILNHTKF
jgi:hypothetical protein